MDQRDVFLVDQIDINAGFCALVVFVLNGVRIAQDNNQLPVVHIPPEATRYFHEPERGDNVWEYWFEPVAHVSSGDLEAALASRALAPTRIHRISLAETQKRHHTDPQRLATFWAHVPPADPEAWMSDKRSLGREYVRRFVRVRPEITHEVQCFAESQTPVDFLIGAHVRGSDFSYASPTGPDVYFREIERQLDSRSPQSWAVFLATDQEQFVERFAERYGSRLVTRNAARSRSDVPPFHMKHAGGYQLGLEVLIDVLLLARCDHILKCAAAGGEMALWFNPDLSCTDFALTSHFDSRLSYETDPAFLSLGVESRSPGYTAALRVSRRLIKQLRQRTPMLRAWGDLLQDVRERLIERWARR